MNYESEFIIPKKRQSKRYYKPWKFKINDVSNFQDDVWDLTSLLTNRRSAIFASSHINFKLLSSKPKIIEPIKRYLYIRLGQVKLSRVTLEYNALSSKLILFLEEKGFTSLESIDTNEFINFNYWLRENYLKKATLTYLSRISYTLLQIITLGQSLNFPLLPKEAILLETSIWDWWGVNSSFRQKNEQMTDRSIPLNLWKNILQKAWSEKSISRTIQSGKSEGLIRVNHAKFAILIQAHTGLRISEVLYIKRNAVYNDNQGLYWLDAQIEKTEIEPAIHTILIPEKIYMLIKELEEITKELSTEAENPNYLFYLLSKPRRNVSTKNTKQRYKPNPVESGKYNSTIFRPFLERNNIPTQFKNLQGKEIKLTSHCFRHTYARIAVIENGLNAKVLQTHFKHLSLEMTMHYIYLHQNDLKKSYIQGMMEHKDILTQGAEGKRFKELINAAQTVHDLQETTSNLSKYFGINPLPFGLCLYDFKRGHCPHLGASSCYMVGCSDFITNKNFLKNFQHEKEILNQQILHAQKVGQIIEVKKAKFHLHKVETIIQKLQKD